MGVCVACEVLSIMFCMFQRCYDQDRLSYGFEIPGSVIPKWFSQQKVGDSVNLQLPSHLCNQFMGIAVCVIFVFCQHYPHDQLRSIDDYGYYRATHRLWCSVKANRFAPNELYLLYRKNLVRLNRISFGWNIIPLNSLETSGEKN